MAKQYFGEVVGKCVVCTINLWDESNGEPAIWPCGVKDCPYEDSKLQNQHLKVDHRGAVGSGLGQIEF